MTSPTIHWWEFVGIVLSGTTGALILVLLDAKPWVAVSVVLGLGLLAVVAGILFGIAETLRLIAARQRDVAVSVYGDSGYARSALDFDEAKPENTITFPAAAGSWRTEPFPFDLGEDDEDES